jgi:hypothetical protein
MIDGLALHLCVFLSGREGKAETVIDLSSRDTACFFILSDLIHLSNHHFFSHRFFPRADLSPTLCADAFSWFLE